MKDGVPRVRIDSEDVHIDAYISRRSNAQSATLLKTYRLERVRGSKVVSFFFQILCCTFLLTIYSLRVTR